MLFFALTFVLEYILLSVNACSYGQLRLFNTNTANQGLLEICINNVWGTVCDDHWTNANARVACRQLGYSTIGATYRSNAYYGQGTGSIFLDDVRCTGSESTLLQCSHNSIGWHNCGHNEDVSVLCSVAGCIYGELRLVGSSNDYEGRLEICNNNVWGTVCDDYWTTANARVACRQLGYPIIGATYHSSAYYGQGTGSILLDNVRCTGSESTLLQCSRNSIGPHNCNHSEDVSVTCKRNVPTGIIILSRNNVSSNSYYYGIVRIHYNEWGNIYKDIIDYSNEAGNVICHQLGYTGASSYSRTGLTNYGTDYLSPQISRLRCNNGIQYLTVMQCSYSTFIDNLYSNLYDATVYCYGTRIWNSNPFPGMVRLQGGAYSSEGRVEVYCNGQWGIICDDEFDDSDANTICRQLGYTGHASYNINSSLAIEYGRPIWLNHFQSSLSGSCFGSMNSCPSSIVTPCSYSEDVTISCIYSPPSSNDAREGHCRNSTSNYKYEPTSEYTTTIWGGTTGTFTVISTIIIALFICCAYRYKKLSNNEEEPRNTLLEMQNTDSRCQSPQLNNCLPTTVVNSRPPPPPYSAAIQYSTLLSTDTDDDTNSAAVQYASGVVAVGADCTDESAAVDVHQSEPPQYSDLYGRNT